MVGNCSRGDSGGRKHGWRLTDSLAGEFALKVGLSSACVAIFYAGMLLLAPSAHASQEDDLHRIAVAVEKIAQHAERCK